MGIGQHYHQAAWIGKEFTYGTYIPNPISSRDNTVEWINPNNIFKLDKISKEDLEKNIEKTSAEHIFSSGNKINLNVEKEFKFNDIEHSPQNNILPIIRLSEKNLNTQPNLNKFYNNLLPFIALHESRTLSVFNYYLKLLKEFKEFKEFISNESFFELLRHNMPYFKYVEHNKKIRNELNEFLNNLNNKNIAEHKKIYNNMAMIFFNCLYPKIYQEKLKKYQTDYQWEIKTISQGSFGIGDVSIVDFSENWTYSFEYFPFFKDLHADLKNLLKNSVFSIISKNKIIWGINKKNKEAYSFYLKNNSTCLLNDLKTGLIFYLFHCSTNYYLLTSDIQKDIIFEYIITNFYTIKNQPEVKFSIQSF